jgi:hypothetical protein
MTARARATSSKVSFLATDQFARLTLAPHSVQELEHLAVDETAERMRCLGQARGEQTTNLVDYPLLELRLDTPRDAPGRFFR